jgi:hypothetical protein
VARLRTIKPAFFTNEQLAACSPLARLLFAGLWCLADRAGKLHDRPRKIKVEILPYERGEDANPWLEELTREGLILRYEGANGARYLKVLGFEKHQKPHPREPPSEIPEPDPAAASREKILSGRVVSSDPWDPDPDPGSSVTSSQPPASPEVTRVPVVGQAAEVPITEAQVAEWQATFPALDVRALVLQAAQWCRDNPARRKTANGVRRFVGSWLARQQNSGRLNGTPKPRVIAGPGDFSDPEKAREGFLR